MLAQEVVDSCCGCTSLGLAILRANPVRHLLLLLLAASAWAQAPVRYEISFPNAVHHEAQVRATFSDVKQPVLDVVMSRSSPGRYALHEFAKNVYGVRVTDGEGHELTVDRADPYSWRVSGHKGTVVVEYTR